MKFKALVTKVESFLTHADIQQAKCYRCVYSPSGTYDGWILFGVDYAGVIGVWIEKYGMYCNDTFSYEDFRFVEIKTELVEVE